MSEMVLHLVAVVKYVGPIDADEVIEVRLENTVHEVDERSRGICYRPYQTNLVSESGRGGQHEDTHTHEEFDEEKYHY